MIEKENAKVQKVTDPEKIVTDELTSLRTETSKTFGLGNGIREVVVSMGAVHYKDSYTDKSEQWKDIDLTWEGNKITKAPYDLALEGNKLTIRDKKSGEVSTIELLEIGKEFISLSALDETLDTDVEIVVENSSVRFARILKSDKAPTEAKFKVTGNFRVSARDTDGELPVVSTLKGGILTENLGLADRAIKYPVRIDPTWQVGTSTDDTWRRLEPLAFNLAETNDPAGAATDEPIKQYGCGMRFTNITIPKGASITEAYLTLRADVSEDGATCNTRISAEDVDDAPTFANDAAAFDTRWAARTTARVNWDNIAAWVEDTDYDSPDIKTVIQEVIDRDGWASGQDMVIFWEDFEDRSTPYANRPLRRAYAYDASTTYCPKLVITYVPAPVPVADGDLIGIAIIRKS